MKPNKRIVNIIVILVAFALFILWYQNKIEDTTRATSALIKYYNVYLITPNVNQYWEFIDQGASKMATGIGVNYSWVVPTERTAAKQIEVINEVVDNGANALLVAADDPKKISSTIEDAKARGVKIIYVDSPANEEAITTLATDNYEAGVLAGQTMVSQLEKLGIKSGSIGIISVEEKQNTELRELGFRKVLALDGRYTLLDTVYTNGEPVVAKAEAIILINANKDLVGLFGTSSGTSEGVGTAINEENSKIVGIGFDQTDINLALLRDGGLKAIMAQNPFTMGYLGMAQAVAAILGNETGPSYLNTGISVMER